MSECEEYLRTHGDALQSALVRCYEAAQANNDADNVSYYQHEINALVEVMRKVPK